MFSFPFTRPRCGAQSLEIPEYEHAFESFVGGAGKPFFSDPIHEEMEKAGDAFEIVCGSVRTVFSSRGRDVQFSSVGTQGTAFPETNWCSFGIPPSQGFIDEMGDALDEDFFAAHSLEGTVASCLKADFVSPLPVSKCEVMQYVDEKANDIHTSQNFVGDYASFDPIYCGLESRPIPPIIETSEMSVVQMLPVRPGDNAYLVPLESKDVVTPVNKERVGEKLLEVIKEGSVELQASSRVLFFGAGRGDMSMALRSVYPSITLVEVDRQPRYQGVIGWDIFNDVPVSFVGHSALEPLMCPHGDAIRCGADDCMASVISAASSRTFDTIISDLCEDRSRKYSGLGWSAKFVPLCRALICHLGANLKDGGTLIMKIPQVGDAALYELLHFLRGLFDGEAYLIKPHASRFTNGEVFWVSHDYKGSDCKPYQVKRLKDFVWEVLKHAGKRRGLGARTVVADKTIWCEKKEFWDPFKSVLKVQVEWLNFARAYIVFLSMLPRFRTVGAGFVPFTLDRTNMVGAVVGPVGVVRVRRFKASRNWTRHYLENLFKTAAPSRRLSLISGGQPSKVWPAENKARVVSPGVHEINADRQNKDKRPGVVMLNDKAKTPKTPKIVLGPVENVSKEYFLTRAALEAHQALATQLMRLQHEAFQQELANRRVMKSPVQGGSGELVIDESE